MLDKNFIIFLSIGILFSGSIISFLFHKINSRKFHGSISIITSLISLLAIIYLCINFINHPFSTSPFSQNLFNIINLNLILRADGINLFFALFGSFISFCVCIYSIEYMSHEKKGMGRFFGLMQLFIGGYLGVVLSDNLIWTYIFFELIGLCSYQLIGFWYERDLSSYSAKKAYLMTHIAGYGLLLGIIAIAYCTHGNLIISKLEGSSFGIYTNIILLGILIACMAKSVQWPLHTWIPFAMNTVTPVSALLHAACLVKAGVYILVKMYVILYPYPLPWNALIVTVGSLTSLIGVMYALKQTEIKKLLAFHTVSQIGYMVAGIGLGTPLGIASALFHALNHGLFKCTLFLCSGIMQNATGSKDLTKMGGLFKKLPFTAALFLIGSFSISGVPGFNGFISKWMFYYAAIQANYPFAAAIGLIASTLTLLSFIKASSTAFFGFQKEEFRNIQEGKYKIEIFSISLLAIFCILIGILPQFLISYLLVPALHSLNLNLNQEIFNFNLGVLLSSGGGYLASFTAIFAIVAIFAPIIIIFATNKKFKRVQSFTGGEVKTSSLKNINAFDYIFDVESLSKNFYRFTDSDKWYDFSNDLLKTTFEIIYIPIKWLENEMWLVTSIVSIIIVIAIVQLIR